MPYPKWDNEYTNWKFLWCRHPHYPKDVALMIYENVGIKHQLPNECIFMWFPDNYWKAG